MKQEDKNVKGWFQLHDRSSFMRINNHNSNNHARWLTKKHPFPIFMHEVHDDIPSSVAFPIKQSIRKFGVYYKSTLAYVVPFAMLAGYKRLEIYGFEMASDTEYWGQRANACYILGKAKALGLEIYVPPTSGLLTGLRYAYSNNLVGARQDLETNGLKLQTDKLEAEAAYQGKQGRLEACEELMVEHPELIEALQPIQKEIIADIQKRNDYIHMVKGLIQGVNLAIRTFDAFSVLEGGSYSEEEIRE